MSGKIKHIKARDMQNGLMKASDINTLNRYIINELPKKIKNRKVELFIRTIIYCLVVGAGHFATINNKAFNHGFMIVLIGILVIDLLYTIKKIYTMNNYKGERATIAHFYNIRLIKALTGKEKTRYIYLVDLDTGNDNIILNYSITVDKRLKDSNTCLIASFDGYKIDILQIN